MDPNHDFTKDLEELIETRNNLAHVEEPAKHLIGPSEVKVEDDRIRAILVVPLNPWSTVSIEKVKRFEQAVDSYFAEVLFPASGEIAESTIVIPAH
ncbi:MAG TPA: hypothetical protein VF899_13715 [Pyrinomonadaceae bacterium]